VEEIVQDPIPNDKPDVNEEEIEIPIENNVDEQNGGDDENIKIIAQDTLFDDGEEPNLADNINEIPKEKKQEESILDDTQFEPNNVNENEVKNTNFGHSDEILINNGDILPNKLNKTKLRRYKSDISGLADIVNYANYTYQTSKPHFTYEDVLQSLTEEERNNVVKEQSNEMNTDESLDSSCGTWQHNYAKLHEDILAGKVEQKYVAYVCEANSNCGNLGDRYVVREIH
jgi:hypothetical protein